MERRPKAFISCSLREQDMFFIDIVEDIVRKKGFLPFGTVGRYVNASEPVPVTMVAEINKADCLIIAATQRYEQYDIHNTGNANRALSEMIQVEAGMASVRDIPIIVFVQKGTHVGNFISACTQYVEVDLENYKQSVNSKLDLVNSLFDRALKKIENKWQTEIYNQNKEGLKSVLQIAGVVGIGSLLFNWMNSEETTSKHMCEDN
jgi:hypothetical protein